MHHQCLSMSVLYSLLNSTLDMFDLNVTLMVFNVILIATHKTNVSKDVQCDHLTKQLLAGKKTANLHLNHVHVHIEKKMKVLKTE